MKALVRRPSPRVADGLVTFIERCPVDASLASAQWAGYVAALEAAGWETVEVEPADDSPDGVFIEDTLVVRGEVAVIARPGAVSRLAELDGVEAAVTRLGFTVQRIEPHGTLDGGDVLQVGDTVYVGTGGRTNAEGLRQLRGILEPLGATVVSVPVSNVLHLKSAVTALPDGSIIGYPPLVEDPELFPRFVPVPEESGAHVVDLGCGKLLLAADCPRTAELFSGWGYEPAAIDIGEFQKLEGCVTCLSVLLGSDPGHP
jgi:dimethylargininase